MLKRLHHLSLSFFVVVLLSSCTEAHVAFYVNKPNYMKKEKAAAFYGEDAKKECEIYRQLYAGHCDTTSQPYVTCFDLNEKKYNLTSCE